MYLHQDASNHCNPSYDDKRVHLQILIQNRNNMLYSIELIAYHII